MLGRPGSVSRPLTPVEKPLARPGQVDELERQLKRLQQKRIEGLTPFTVATVPAASRFPYAQVFITDEAGGAVPAFSDGTNWRRVTDRAIVS